MNGRGNINAVIKPDCPDTESCIKSIINRENSKERKDACQVSRSQYQDKSSGQLSYFQLFIF